MLPEHFLMVSKWWVWWCPGVVDDHRDTVHSDSVMTLGLYNVCHGGCYRGCWRSGYNVMVTAKGWKKNRDKMTTSKDYFKYETQLILLKTLRVAFCFWIKIKN